MVTDESLFERLLRGDLRALDLLYQRYERHLFGFILGQLGERHEAEDVLHDAFLAVLREGRSGRHALVCFRAWIYQVARNLCLNRIRARQRAVRAMDTAAALPAPTPVEPEAALAELQSSTALRRAVSRLPAPLAELFELRAGGLSYDELAQLLGIPVGTVKSRMHELICRLRVEVQP